MLILFRHFLLLTKANKALNKIIKKTANNPSRWGCRRWHHYLVGSGSFCRFGCLLEHPTKYSSFFLKHASDRQRTLTLPVDISGAFLKMMQGKRKTTSDLRVVLRQSFNAAWKFIVWWLLRKKVKTISKQGHDMDILQWSEHTSVVLIALT